MKKMNILILFLGLTLRMYAPENRVMYITEPMAFNPYERVWNAVCKIESGFDATAIGDKHLKQWSYGIGQIRQERLDCYNKATGNHYTIKDLFSPAISRQIFFHYAHQYGPYRIDEAIMRWNGSGPQTKIYLNKVKLYL
jgi:hypothetical protein